MSGRDDEATVKPGLRELVGSAVNTSVLVMNERRETALDRVAGIGAAAYRVSIGADLQKLTAAAAQPEVRARSVDMRALLLDPPGPQHEERDQLAAELGQVLLHIREGDQVGLIPVAIALFARWVSHRQVFATFAGAEHEQLRATFSARAVHEWLSPHCPVCRGSKKQQRSRSGQWLRPQGNMQRNAVFRPCSACNGSGRAAVRHPERMAALGVTREQYDADGWGQRFTAALTWLNTLLPNRMLRALTVELERRKKNGLTLHRGEHP